VARVPPREENPEEAAHALHGLILPHDARPQLSGKFLGALGLLWSGSRNIACVVPLTLSIFFSLIMTASPFLVSELLRFVRVPFSTLNLISHNYKPYVARMIFRQRLAAVCRLLGL